MLFLIKNTYVKKVLTAISLVLLAVGFSLLANNSNDTAEYAIAEEGFEVEKSTNLLNESRPVHISIPDIYVEANFVDLGIDENSEIEIPDSFEEVGWYVHGPTPGELGPSVILGHVDSYEGPAVFFSLGQLEPGDEIEVTREDGSVAVFQVEKLERYLQSEFPTSLVYGDIDHAGLRLITCSGSYDKNLQRYDHNLIVFASLVESEDEG